MHQAAVRFRQQAGLGERLDAKASEGCAVRVALAQPDANAVAARDDEEGLDGGLIARIHTAMRLFKPVIESEAAQFRQHDRPMYNSIFRFDDHMIVTPHLFRRSGFEAPALHLRRLADGGIFDTFTRHFEELWDESGGVVP